MDDINVNMNEIIDGLVDKREDLMSYLFNSTLLYDNYNISIFAKWFHSLPHVDIRLNYLKNTTFNPNDNQYLESLGILVAIPGFWLILTLLFFLIFFLCRCCDANNKKKRKLTLCKCCLFMFAVLSSLIIVVGMFGSLVSHQGLQQVQNNTEDMSSVVEGIKRQTTLISDSFKNDLDTNFGKLKSLFDTLVTDLSVKTSLIRIVTTAQRNASNAERQLDIINKRLEKLDIKSVAEHLKTMESIRWPTTFGVLGSLTFVCLILIWGILRHSRCVLILFSVLGLLSLVVCWVITSVYLGISVAGSDFCLDPQPFISEQFNNAIDEQVFDYYVSCNTQNPFHKSIEEVTKKLEWYKRFNEDIKNLCQMRCNSRDITDKLHALQTDFNRIKEDWQLLEAFLDCQRFHQDYIQMMTSTCKEVLEGVVLMLLSSSATGLCFTVLVLCASHTWINIRKKRPLIADQTEETDPFLPPASSTSTTSSANSKRIRDSYGSAGSGRPRYVCFDFLILFKLNYDL